MPMSLTWRWLAKGAAAMLCLSVSLVEKSFALEKENLWFFDYVVLLFPDDSPSHARKGDFEKEKYVVSQGTVGQTARTPRHSD